MPDHCSFCGKTSSQVRKLIAGGGKQPHAKAELPSVAICDECIEFAAEIVSAEVTGRKVTDRAENNERALAWSRFRCVLANGDAFDASAEVYPPYDTASNEALCNAGISNMYAFAKVAGRDRLEALARALSYVEACLRGFCRDGGTVLRADSGEPVDIDALFGSAHDQQEGA